MICVSIVGRSLIETSSLGHCLAFDSNNYLLALAIFHFRTFDLLTTGTYPIDRSAKEQSRKSSNNIAVTYLPVRITVLFVRISICHCNICSAQWRHVFPSPFQHTKWIFILFNCAPRTVCRPQTNTSGMATVDMQTRAIAHLPANSDKFPFRFLAVGPIFIFLNHQFSILLFSLFCDVVFVNLYCMLTVVLRCR